MREAQTSSLGFSEAALTFLNLARRLLSPTLVPAWGKCGKRFRQRKRQLRARWRPAREPLKKAGCPPSSRRRSSGSIAFPAKASRNRYRASRWHETRQVRRSRLRVGVQYRRSLPPSRSEAAGVTWKPFERSVHRLNLPSRRIKTLQEAQAAKQSNRRARPWFRRTTQIAAREAASHARNPGRGH